MRQMILTTLLCVLAICVSGTALARSDLTLYPVEIVAKKANTWKVAVDVPCGGHFFGFIVQKKGKRQVELGAAIKRERVMCASWPSREIHDVDFLPKGYSVQSKVVRDLFTDLTLGTIREIRTQKSARKGERKLYAVYEDKCRSRYGSLVRKFGGRLEFATVHRKGVDVSEEGCMVSEKIAKIPGVRAYDHDALLPVAKRTKDLDREFRLHLAPVMESSIQSGKLAGVSLKYARACNEAPVGIVLQHDDKGKKLKVGVLLAEYYNMICDEEQGGFTTLSNEDLQIPSNWQLTGMQPPSDGSPGLALRMPTEWETQQMDPKNDNGSGFVIKYYEGCGQLVGSVYSHDAKGNLVVGILQQQKVGQCQKGTRQAAIEQPLRFGSTAPNVLPLRIKGLKGH